MKKLHTNDDHYVIIKDDYSHYNEYYVYERGQFEVDQNIDEDASDFRFKMIKEDQQPQVTISVKWDGCANMNSMADGVMTHFCEKDDIFSYYGMILMCYDDARNDFNF